MRAGEHHVLPDQQAHLVAELVEGVELVEAAAPHADHVHVGGDRFAEQAGDALARDARGQGIGGDPVGALAEDGDAVDLEGHRGAGRVRLIDEPQPAQADAPLRAVAGNGDDGIGKGLVTIPRRPPQGRLRNGQAEIDGAAIRVRHHGFALDFPVAEGEDHRHRAVLQRRQLDLRGHRDRTVVVMVLADHRVLDACVVKQAQLRFGIEAEHHQTRPPVPAAMALRLAQHVEIGDAVVLGVRDREGLLRRPRRRFPGRRAETDGDLVFSRTHHAGEVDAMADEARIEAGDRRAVDGHLGDGVEKFEVEHRPFAGKRFRRDVEGAADLPFLLMHPLHVGFVGADRGLGNAPGGDECGVDVAGDGAGRYGRATGVVKGP